MSRLVSQREVRHIPCACHDGHAAAAGERRPVQVRHGKHRRHLPRRQRLPVPRERLCALHGDHVAQQHTAGAGGRQHTPQATHSHTFSRASLR